MNIKKNFVLPERSAALVEYWREARGPASLPNRKYLSPLKLRRWVGDVSIVHLHDGPKRFFVSLHGANVSRHIGPAFHRRYLEDAVPEASLRFALAPYLESIAHHVPAYSIMVPNNRNALHSRLEKMVLPFCGENPDAVDRFLVWAAPNDREGDETDSIYGACGDLENRENSFALFRLNDDEARPAMVEARDAVAA